MGTRATKQRGSVYGLRLRKARLTRMSQRKLDIAAGLDESAANARVTGARVSQSAKAAPPSTYWPKCWSGPSPTSVPRMRRWRGSSPALGVLSGPQAILATFERAASISGNYGKRSIVYAHVSGSFPAGSSGYMQAWPRKDLFPFTAGGCARHGKPSASPRRHWVSKPDWTSSWPARESTAMKPVSTSPTCISSSVWLKCWIGR